jgi:hypothetical protein
MFARGIQFPGIFFDTDDKGGGGEGGGEGSGGNGGAGGGTGGGAGKKEGEGEGGTASGNGGKGDSGSSGGQGKGDEGKEGGGKKPPQFSAEQQAEIDRIAANARAEGKKTAKKEADEAKLREEGKFKDLHEAAEKRIKEELEPKAALADELSTEVNTSIDEELKDWPDSLKKQDPGKDDVRNRLKWVRSSRDLAKELKAVKTAPNGEHGSGGGSSDKSLSPAALLRPGFRTPGGAKKA